MPLPRGVVGGENLLLKKRRLGKTNLLVSEISLGTVEIGMDYGIAAGGGDRRPDEAAAEALLHRALDLGINYIDTARAYGESEAIIGRVLKSRRQEFVLASKLSADEKETASPGTLRDHFRRSLDESLRALQTDRIDVMMLHSASASSMAGQEVWEALDRLRRTGEVRFIGVSVYGPEAARLAIDSGACDCIQIAYSLLDRRPEADVLARARKRDVGIVVRSVLLKGVLTYRYRHLPEELAPLRSAAEAAARLGKNGAEGLPELAYRYVLSNPLTGTALVGASKVEEVDAAVRYAQMGPLAAEAATAIRKIEVSDEKLLHPGLWP